MGLLKSLLEYGLLPSVAVIVAVVTWLLNHRSQVHLRRVQQTEERYGSLLDSLDGFFSNTVKPEKKDEFIRQYRQCWLYSPDSVVKAMNGFLDSVSVGASKSDAEKKSAFAKCVLAMRRDQFSNRPLKSKRSTLTEDDFRFSTAQLTD